MATTRPARTSSPIPDALLHTVYASDQAMYPAAPPYARLRAWVDACPDLSVCFGLPGARGRRDEHGQAAPEEGAAGVASVSGVVVVLPLRRPHWEDLLAGRLKEAEIDPGAMFPRRGKDGGASPGASTGGGREEVEEVGLHVYHIERFGTPETESRQAATAAAGEGSSVGRPRFAELALAEVMRRVPATEGWKVVGMSALTATPAGERAFARLGFAPTGYRELFVVRDPDRADDGSDKGQRMEMICVYPGSEGNPQAGPSRGTVVSTSEMYARYGGATSLVFT